MSFDADTAAPDAIEQGHNPAPEREEAASAPETTTRDVIADLLEKAERGEHPGAAAATPSDTGQPRAPDGKFAPKTETPAASPAPAAAAQPAEGQQPAAPAQAPDVPASWRGGREALWQKADPEVRQAILDREAEMARGVEPFKGLAPFVQHAQRSGLSLADMMGAYARAEQRLATDFPGAVQELAATFGYDLSQLANALATHQAQAAAPQAPVFPEFRQLDGRIGQVESMIRQQQVSAAQAEVDRFAADPAHKHFKDVEADVARLLLASRQTGDNLSLKDAYEQAIWANPAVRAKLIAEQKAQEVAQAAKATTAAKAASKSISTAAPRSQPAAQETTIGVLSALWDERVGT